MRQNTDLAAQHQARPHTEAGLTFRNYSNVFLKNEIS